MMETQCWNLEIQYIEKIIINPNNIKNASEDYTGDRKMQGQLFWKWIEIPVTV